MGCTLLNYSVRFKLSLQYECLQNTVSLLHYIIMLQKVVNILLKLRIANNFAQCTVSSTFYPFICSRVVWLRLVWPKTFRFTLQIFNHSARFQLEMKSCHQKKKVQQNKPVIMSFLVERNSLSLVGWSIARQVGNYTIYDYLNIILQAMHCWWISLPFICRVQLENWLKSILSTV